MSMTTSSTPPPPAAAPAATELAKLAHELSAGPQARPKSRQLVWKLAAGLAAVALLAWGAIHWLTPSGTALPQITASVTCAMLPITVTERGELESSKTVDVRCEVEGKQIKIVEIVPEGTRVTKYQIVVRFDSEELTREYAKQEIALKQAEGKAKAVKEELEVQKNKAASEIAKADLALTLGVLDKDKYLQGEYLAEVEDRKGAIALAQRDLEEAEEKLKNYRTFVKKGFGTEEQLRLKEAEVAKARYYLKRDQEKLKVLEVFTRKRQEAELTAKAEEAKRELARTKSSSAASIAKAQSELEAAEVTTRLEQASLDRFQRQLERCTVRAPQEGIIVYSRDRYWDVSSRIQVGGVVHYQQRLFSIPDLAQMQVKVKIHEAMVKKVKIGQAAEIRVESYGDHVLHGTVQKVATLADSPPWDESGVKEYATIVTIDDLPVDAGLKPGMTAEVKIMVNQLDDVLVVPVQAVTEKEGAHYSYVVRPGGVERRQVIVGENNDKVVEIKSGLSEGQQVALDARARIAAEFKSKDETANGPSRPSRASKPDAEKVKLPQRKPGN